MSGLLAGLSTLEVTSAVALGDQRWKLHPLRWSFHCQPDSVFDSRDCIQ